MLDGLDYDELYRRCYEENYVEIESLERRREVTLVVYNRLCALDEFPLKEFYGWDVAASKFILLSCPEIGCE